MRRLVIIFFGIILCGELFAPGRHEAVILLPEPIRPYEALWQAVCMVESSNNPYAINVTEQAYGIAQIRQIRLDDYAQRTGIVYTLEDCFDINIAKSIWLYYAEINGPDYEKISKSWNGSGIMTENYWRKVKKHL